MHELPASSASRRGATHEYRAVGAAATCRCTCLVALFLSAYCLMFATAAPAGQESPAKAQLSASSTQSADKQALPVSWTMGELIGQGAFGSVYLGMDNETGQLMAVKQVSISKAAERGGKASEHIKGLEAEVHLLHKLNHPNIVRYLVSQQGAEWGKAGASYVHGVPGAGAVHLNELLSRWSSGSRVPAGRLTPGGAPQQEGLTPLACECTGQALPPLKQNAFQADRTCTAAGHRAH